MADPIVETAEAAQSKILTLGGRFFSYVFHPLFIPLYVSIYLVFYYPYAFAGYDNSQKLLRLLHIFVITTFFPAITVFLLWRLQFAASIYLKTQKERIIPYVASVTYFFWAFYVSKNLPGTPDMMTFFFLGIFLTASAGLMANNYFKISMHALGVGGATGFLILLGLVSPYPMGLAIAVATIVTGIICTSRLLVSDHSPFEIYAGLLVAFCCQAVACYFIM